MRAQFGVLPLISRSLTVLQQETRALRGAFNDFARTNVTAGEIEALHADVNRVQAENANLQTRLATVERRLEELQRRRPVAAASGVRRLGQPPRNGRVRPRAGLASGRATFRIRV